MLNIEGAFRFVTIALMIGLVTSALFHVVLYISDSEVYRRWVTVQIVIQLAGAISLFFVLRYSTYALATFVVLSIPFMVINWRIINYGNDFEQILGISCFWLVYGSLIFKVRRNFIGNWHSKSGSGA